MALSSRASSSRDMARRPTSGLVAGFDLQRTCRGLVLHDSFCCYMAWHLIVEALARGAGNWRWDKVALGWVVENWPGVFLCAHLVLYDIISKLLYDLRCRPLRGGVNQRYPFSS